MLPSIELSTYLFFAFFFLSSQSFLHRPASTRVVRLGFARIDVSAAIVEQCTSIVLETRIKLAGFATN